MVTTIPRFTIQDNEEFICWLSTFGGPHEETCGEPAIQEDDPILAFLPSWLTTIDNNSNNVPDIFEFVPDLIDTLPENVVYIYFSESSGPPISGVNELTLAMIAMYYHRYDIGLETKEVETVPPELVPTDGCSGGTARVIFSIEDAILNGENTSADLQNMRNFLMNVAQWIKDRPKSDDPSAVSPHGFVFTANDNQLCKMTFNSIEQESLDLSGQEEEIKGLFSELYNDILDKKGDIKFVDNEEFIIWALEAEDIEPEDIRLPSYVARSFLSVVDASPITSESQLQ